MTPIYHQSLGRYSRHVGGSALIVTLAILVLIAILVVGLSETVRLERASSKKHLERARAMDFARMGVENAVATLRDHTVNTNINWVTSPGRIVSSQPGTNTLTTQADLFSGVSTNSQTGFLRPPDLNIPQLLSTSGEHLLTDRRTTVATNDMGMPIRWIYVRRDGSIDTNEPPDLSNAGNPVTGRFAYWTDDESTKINYNIAWKRETSPSGPPQTQLSLSVLPGLSPSDANTIHQAITTDGYTNVTRFYNSPYDIRRLGGGIADLATANKFDLTYYNADPDTTFFNEPRIVLTTQANLAEGRPFLDILATPNSDPGTGAVNTAKLRQTIKLLTDYLRRNDWPMTSASASFQDKYYGSNPDRLTQLALNIIDYVRCKESTAPVVAPLRGENDASGNFTPGAAFGANGFMSMTRTPLINEVGVYVSPARTQMRAKIELFLPPHYGIDSLKLTGYYLFVQIKDGATTLAHSDYPIPAGTTISAGQYLTITIPVSPLVPMVTRPSQMAVRFALSKPDLSRLDIAPQVDISSGYELICPINPDTVAENAISSLEVDDPRVNKFRDDWKPGTDPFGNTFGKQNSVFTGGQLANMSISPEQDTDSSGRISTASLFMPHPKGHPDNPKGMVISSGELGYIHTGIQGSGLPGTPWRTLRLQPNKAANTVMVPDWAFMDLFTAPESSPAAGKSVLRPQSSSIGGRVNINTKLHPFSSFSNPFERTYPLAAVFQGAANNSSGGTISPSEALNIAQNIYYNILASSGKSYGHADFFDSAGEIVEIKGVADNGEESEAIVRDIFQMITARGNVFTTYSIGQALKQTPSSAIEVNAEQRLQVVVERFGSNPAAIRTVYFRTLNP